MSYPFDYRKEIRDGFEEFAKKPVLVKGMKLIEMGYVKIADIDTKHYNFGRAEGRTDSPHIVELRALFRANEYEPQYHEPPVVTTEGKLVTGKHRFVGARLEGVEYIWVAVCTFATDKAIHQYAIMENLRKSLKMEADQEAVVYNVISAIQAGEVKKNTNAVRNYLKEIDYKDQIQKTVDMVLSSVLDDYKQMTNPTRDEIIDAVEEEFDVDVANAPDWVVATLKGGTGDVAGDRHARLWKKVQPLLVKGIDVNVAAAFSNTASKDIPQNRENIKNNYLKDHIDQSLRVADAIKSGNLGNINWNFKTQIEGEDGHFVEID
jgi:hypothetical protein